MKMIPIDLYVSVEMYIVLDRLSSGRQDKHADAIVRALALLDLAADAAREGNRLAILAPDGTVVDEITGHEPGTHGLRARDTRGPSLVIPGGIRGIGDPDAPIERVEGTHISSETSKRRRRR